MPSASAETTVRHTPFTARLSPGGEFRRDRRRQPDAESVRGRLDFARPRPIASINPVNISLDQRIGAERRGR